jgi:predicted esterase
MRRLLPILLLIFAGCARPTPAAEARMQVDASAGELAARPGSPATRSTQTGLRWLGSGARAALLYVPRSYSPEKPLPLIVMLHGAGGSGQHSADLVTDYADRLGFIILAPSSRAASWDIISSRSYGADVAPLDAALKQVFAEYAVDPKRLAVAGFSDGASYALSLGIINGDLFSDIIAFSPGFMAPTRAEGRPNIFVSHGVQDRVLPIDVCSRRIVPQLKAGGYKVDYREFPGGHTVPPDLASAAYQAFAT